MMNDKTGIRFTLRLIVAAYLIYVGVQQFRSYSSSDNPTLLFVFGVIFVAVGAFYAFYAFKSFRKDDQGKDDK